MAGHDLIETYLADLSGRLPADAVDELADGLTETYHRHLSTGVDGATAARRAIVEFGEPDAVLAAFVAESPGRRTARTLLWSGPTVGLCWGAALVAGRAWTWPVPAPLRLALGAALLTVIGTLVAAATARRSYHRTRLATIAGLVLIVLDSTMLTAVALVAVPFVWPMVLAVPASLTRLVLTARAMPRLLAH
jgi:hypothetical protein